MSIDREVNSRANAYRGNETALKEMYAGKKQLIDLLALQKLKSEREAAEKEIQMKAQVSPTTVADQLENENFQAIKQQIVGDMPQEGILAAAQGGMVRGFAEGGEIENEIAYQVQRATRGFISPFTGNTPNRVLEGSPAYRQKEKEAREEVFREEVDDLLEEKLDPKTVQSDEDFEAANIIKNIYDKGQISAEQLYEVIKNDQLLKLKTEVETEPEVGTGATGTVATTEPPISAYEKIMEKYGASYKDQIANLNKEDRIKRREDRLARLAEINKPEEKEAIDVILAAMKGRGAYGAGGASYALDQDELARRKRNKEYQTMLVENEEKIDDLAQELGDKEMAIILTTATNEYARDVAAKALAIENIKDRRDFILKAMDTMGTKIGTSITENPYVNAELKLEGKEAAKELAGNLREIFMDTPGYAALEKMLTDMGVSPSGTSSSGKQNFNFSSKTQEILRQQ